MRIFRKREDSLKFGLSFFFIVGSILGTMFCNFMTDDMKLGLTATEQGMVTSSSLSNLDFTVLFFRIISSRMWILFLFFLISMTARSYPFIMAGCGCFGFSSAAVMCTLTMEYGAWSVVRYFAFLFPQCLMYVPAMYIILWWMPVNEKRLTILSAVLLVILVIIGACLETLVNPWILLFLEF